ncbi:MAG: hypothetical protein Q9173_004572 [Seirophora scorigena]
MDGREDCFGLTSSVHRSGSAEDALRRGVNLNRNIEALYASNPSLSRIENPLSHLTPDQLERDARAFARHEGLDADLIIKGARIAKDPQYFATIPGVTEEEKLALQDEKRHRFRQPSALYLTIVVCSIGAAVQGWDQTGSNGANLNWPEAFGLNIDQDSDDFWILGLVNAAPYFAAALIGCWLSHPLNYRIGRRGTIFFAAWFCFLSVLGSACTQTWVQLFICRILLGVGMGAKASTIPVLAAENAPASIRGTLVMGWQLWVAFGILLGFTANLILFQIGSIAWRLQLGSAFIPAVPLIALVYYCPVNLLAFYSSTLLRDANASEKNALLVSWGFGLVNFVYGFVFPLQNKSGLNLIAFIMIFLWVPETKQRTLEELDQIFGVPTVKHMNYQVSKVVPCAFRRNTNPSAAHLCASVQQIIENYSSSYESLSEADIDPFRLEVQTLCTFLHLFDKVRNAREPRLDVEESHISDVTHLLHGCQRTLANLDLSLKRAWQPAAAVQGQQPPWNLNAPTFTVPRFYISFYTRTLEMTLMGISLGVSYGWDEFSKITQALLLTISQRKDLTGEHYHEESVEEMDLLRDVEQCVRSAEVFISTASSEVLGRSPPDAQAQRQPNGPSAWSADLSLRNGSGTSSPNPPSRIEDHASDDSDVESIEPDMVDDDGFSADTYMGLIEGLRQDLRDKMERHDYRDAEVVCKTISKHSIDRENQLGIPFGDRPELDETLVEIYLQQMRYQKAKKILRQLLQQQGPMDMDRNSKLHFLLARAYRGRDQLDKARSFAQRSLKGRESLCGQEDPLTQQSALLLIAIYEAQRDFTTANGLRRHHCPHSIPPPPPKSALRQPSQQHAPVPPLSSHDIPSTDHQAPLRDDDGSYHANKHRVHWAPDVVASDSSINALSDSGQTKLIYGIRQGDDVYVKLTLERGASVDTPCADEITPLMHAVMVESKSIVEILLDYKADVEVRTCGWTPLHKATDMSSLAIMQLLLDAGAYIEATSPWEFIPPRSEAARLRAIARDEPDLEAEILCQRNQKWTPLLRAAFKGDSDAATLLLSHSANIEARNPHKATALIGACENLHFSTVSLLLNRGANVGAADEFGLTPLHRCCYGSSPSQTRIITSLLERSADINAKCNHGCTPLHIAVKYKHLEIVSFLLAHKADIEARDSADLTPLHTAINVRCVPMVRLLLEHGADASAMTEAREDALAAAKHAERPSPEIQELLVKHNKRVKEASAAMRGGVKKTNTIPNERRVSNASAGPASVSDARIAESSKKGEKKGFLRKLSKGK